MEVLFGIFGSWGAERGTVFRGDGFAIAVVVSWASKGEGFGRNAGKVSGLSDAEVLGDHVIYPAAFLLRD